MADDIDLLLVYSKQDWRFPFKQMRNGYPGCPLLDNMLKAAEDLITSLFRTFDVIMQVKAVAEYLILNNLVSPNVLQMDTRTKNELLKILKSTNN